MKVKIEVDLEVISTKKQLERFKSKCIIRDDWYEPAEEGITGFVVGPDFDNSHSASTIDYALVLYYSGKPIALVNLAMLCAWATGYEEKEKE